MSNPTNEVPQASGALTQMVLATETDWGVLNGSPHWKRLNVVPGETGDRNLQVYSSRVIRADRLSNQMIRGTQRPAGSLPFELAPTGVSQLLYHLLGWKQSTTGTGPYTHVLRGWGTSASRIAQDFPSGFTLEKGFLELSTPYLPYYGCRINTGTFSFNVDNVVSGSFDWLAREEGAFSASSQVGMNSVSDLTADPFTSVQVTLYEGASLVPLATASTLNLSITNSMRASYVLGSNYAANIKPGTRMSTGSGSFLFNSTALYDKANAGTQTAIEILCTNGIYSIQFLMPNVEFTPSNSTPKITDDGPLLVSANYKAVYDASIDSDIQCTIVSPESSIVN